MESLENKKNPIETSIIPWIGKTSKLIDSFLQEKLRENGFNLSKEQVVVLKRVYAKEGINQNDLAFLTLRDKSSLTRLLVKMERKNYIKRSRCKKDKRISQVYLTDLGRELYSKIKPVFLELLHFLGEGITVEEKEITIRVLKKIQLNTDLVIKAV